MPQRSHHNQNSSPAGPANILPLPPTAFSIGGAWSPVPQWSALAGPALPTPPLTAAAARTPPFSPQSINGAWGHVPQLSALTGPALHMPPLTATTARAPLSGPLSINRAWSPVPRQSALAGPALPTPPLAAAAAAWAPLTSPLLPLSASHAEQSRLLLRSLSRSSREAELDTVPRRR